MLREKFKSAHIFILHNFLDQSQQNSFKPSKSIPIPSNAQRFTHQLGTAQNRTFNDQYNSLEENKMSAIRPSFEQFLSENPGRQYTVL